MPSWKRAQQDSWCNQPSLEAWKTSWISSSPPRCTVGGLFFAAEKHPPRARIQLLQLLNDRTRCKELIGIKIHIQYRILQNAFAACLWLVDVLGCLLPQNGRANLSYGGLQWFSSTKRLAGCTILCLLLCARCFKTCCSSECHALCNTLACLCSWAS